jgi:predicted nucleic acid-binding protein
MTQVVADTTLLRYLIEIDAVDVLPVLFGQVMTAPAVIQDLRHTNTPTPVRAWIASPPPWLVMQAPRSPYDLALHRLGAGEHEAILLVHEHQPAFLVTDDRRARRTAQARGLQVVGTIWVLERAAERELIDLPPVLARSRTTNIRLHSDVIQEALARDAARKAGAQESPSESQER